MNIKASDHEALSEMAIARDCSVDDLVHEAIADFLEREAEEAFYQRALKSHQKFLEDGLHLTSEEVREWINQLEEDPNTPLPPCHT